MTLIFLGFYVCFFKCPIFLPFVAVWSLLITLFSDRALVWVVTFEKCSVQCVKMSICSVGCLIIVVFSFRWVTMFCRWVLNDCQFREYLGCKIIWVGFKRCGFNGEVSVWISQYAGTCVQVVAIIAIIARPDSTHLTWVEHGEQYKLYNTWAAGLDLYGSGRPWRPPDDGGSPLRLVRDFVKEKPPGEPGSDNKGLLRGKALPLAPSNSLKPHKISFAPTQHCASGEFGGIVS